MKPPYTLLETSASHETVDVLEQLLDQAKHKQIIGIAFVAMYRGRTFISHSTGECYRNPVFTRGMLQSLNDQLGRHPGD